MIEFIKRYVLGFHENAERWEKLRVIITLILIVLIINLTWVLLDARSDLKEYTAENCYCVDPEDQNNTSFFNTSIYSNSDVLSPFSRPAAPREILDS